MHVLTGKLGTDIEISNSPEKIYEIFCSEPSKLCSICPDAILACDLLDGEWGILGSITQWSYVLGGETKIAKLIIDSADSTNNSITYRVLEGDLMLQFSLFTVKIEATQKEWGNVVSLTLEYTKLSLGVDDPQAMLELGIQVIKTLDAYLTTQA